MAAYLHSLSLSAHGPSTKYSFSGGNLWNHPKLSPEPNNATSAITSGSKLQAALLRISFPQTSNYSLRLATFVRSFSMNAFVHLSSAQSLIIRSQALYLPFAASRLVPFHTAVRARKMSSTTKSEEKFAPAR